MAWGDGEAAFFYPRRPSVLGSADFWACHAAEVVHKIVRLSDYERALYVQRGRRNSDRFNLQVTLDKLETIYHSILEHSNKG
ncbi:hypothetical protein SAMN05444008_111173 [Cnuella takakiae]|uniref:Uncharacterized protein n=1 Tax=Cnuella takakiae TaxID=1302690 RepID=A0A1M5E1W5_9BACT|nr:hypothetical protein SAMN05444008_111173 [Cnuella takakiae]